MIDCIRKVWGKSSSTALTKSSTNTPPSHRQRGKGTDSALLQRIAVAEAAQESQYDLYTSSGDFRKAFDSASKPIIRLAWTRLGVPPDVVEWIFSLDENPHIIHLTPHSQANWHPNTDEPLATQYANHKNPPPIASPQSEESDKITNVLNQLLTYPLDRTDAFTDGSFTHRDLDVHSVFHTRPTKDPHPPQPTATVSIIFSPPGNEPWKQSHTSK
eukprot:gene7029-biopygen3394